ncbi:hypothetical protein [Acetivibrio straminisolvens]|nr:hypothetical protein [Acetivibrio straminisolvens]
MLDLSEFDKYLIPTEDGMKIDPDAPEDVIKKIQDLDKEYFDVYGQHLIT